MEKDYYSILGVNKGSSQEDIKKSYRKLAIQHHPDKGGDPEVFKEINQAYDVLSNEEKRKEYDMFGSVGGNRFNGPHGFNMDDIFSHFSDMFGGFGGFNDVRQKRGSDLRVKIDVTLNDVIFGSTKKIKYYRDIKCTNCGGMGGTNTKECLACGGSGQRITIKNTPFGTVQQTTPCTNCYGTGRTVSNKCPVCSGNGTQKKEEVLDVNIPPGVTSGMKLNADGRGNHILNGEPGDLHIYISEIPDPEFKREGNNLIYEESISISDAVLGKRKVIKTPHGDVLLNIDPGCESGKTYVFRGKGVPNIHSGNHVNRKGDLNVKIKVEIPKNINIHQREIFTKLKESGL